MLLTLRYAPKAYATLVALSRPQRADQPEALPWVMYDTIAYAAAGSTSLVLYSSTAASLTDPTLSNFPTGTLETFQFFEYHREFLSILAALSLTTTAAVTGAANDVDILHKAARGVRTIAIGQKSYGPFPIDYFGRPGGASFAGTSEGTETAPARNIIQAGETVMNGGFPHLGSYVLAPQTKMTVTLTFNSTAISAQTNLRHSILGIFHRRVS
jgi:hypothetical protein